MVIKEKKDLKPGLKFGVAILLSLGGILYSIIKSKVMKPSQSQSPPLPPPSDSRNQVEYEGEVADCRDDARSLYHEDSYVPAENCRSGLSPGGTSTGHKDEFLLPDFDEILKEFDLDVAKARTPIKDVKPPRSDTESTERVVDSRDDQELQIRNLRNLVKTHKERETALENKLLEYYGLKEQESTIKELRTRLKINSTEAKLFSLKIESLQTDNRRLELQVTDYRKVVADLEAARAQIKLLKGKLRSEAEDNREHILALKERVTKLQEQKLVAVESKTDIHPQLEKVKDLEKQIEVLKKSNYNLQQENSDLGQRLDHAQAAAYAQENKEAALKAESQLLRKQNEELTKEVEQLQEDRCADVEELVYLRWINACLRYELRNYQPSQGQTAARDLSRTLSPKSEKKAKQLILEYANNEGLDGRGINCTEFDSDHSSSSRASYLTDSGELDDSSVDHSSGSKNNTSGRRKIFSGLIKLLRGHHQTGGSSLEVPAPTEYVVGRDSTDSPVFIHGFSKGTDGKSSKPRTLSFSSTRLSLESSSRFAWDHHKPAYFQELRTENSANVAVSPRDNELNRQTEKDEKTNLLKYAGALMDKPGKTTKLRRKAASFSSL